MNTPTTTTASIDLIDSKGNIREHDVSRIPGCEDFTRCGLRIGDRNTQTAMGNARCGRCDMLRRKDGAPVARVYPSTP